MSRRILLMALVEISEQKEEVPESVNDIETETIKIEASLDDLLNAVGVKNVFTSNDKETNKDAMKICRDGGTE